MRTFPLGYDIAPGALSPLDAPERGDLLIVISGVETQPDPTDFETSVRVLSSSGKLREVKTVDVAFYARHGGGLTYAG